MRPPSDPRRAAADAARALARRLAAARPDLALLAATVAAPALAPAPPDDAALASLFAPDAPPRRLRAALRADALRQRALAHLIHTHGFSPLAPLVAWDDDARHLRDALARGRAAAVSWHLGPYRAWPSAMALVGAPCVSAAHLPTADWPSTSRPFVVDTPARRLAFLKAAADALRTPGHVAFLALDGHEADHPVPIPFLGRALPLGTGAAALARLTGAALVPVTARFAAGGRRLRFRSHPPVARPPGADDRAFTAALAAFFERWARAHPDALVLEEVEHVLRAPRA
ncbi:MAG: hypothetical protein H6745_11365 [Deltaproteobacteria bacterium]|nr:hypothetical protein [Deltaproteobacteria bacterium]